jgi:hypothetical protein
VIDSIHDFQRQGGVKKQLEHLDKVFSSYLLAPDAGSDGQDSARNDGNKGSPTFRIVEDEQ